MGSKYGYRRITQKTEADRISSLPDELLSHILSFLPTKSAVGTSIISKRWDYLWTSITCLDFKNHTDHTLNDLEYTNFVGHVPQSCATLTVLTLRDCQYYDPEGVSFNLPRLKVLHINEIFSRFIKNLIRSCPVLEDLTLGEIVAWYMTDTIMISAHTLKTMWLQDLPRGFALLNFDSLTCMEVISCDNRFWAMLPTFIGSTPSLEVLSLKQCGDDNVIDDGYDWVEPKFVPKCVVHHLEVINVEGLKGRKHELQLIKYFLGNAKVLKTLTVNCQELKREEEIKFFLQLLEYTRASKDCEVDFHGNVFSNL